MAFSTLLPLTGGIVPTASQAIEPTISAEIDVERTVQRLSLLKGTASGAGPDHSGSKVIGEDSERRFTMAPGENGAEQNGVYAVVPIRCEAPSARAAYSLSPCLRVNHYSPINDANGRTCTIRRNECVNGHCQRVASNTAMRP